MKPAKTCFILLVLGILTFLFSPNPAQAQGLFIRGDVNCDGSVTPADTTYLGDYLLRGGPGPACRAAADLNDNGIINLEDYFYLVNYFSGGPAPFPPFPICGTDLSGAPCTLSCCPGTECSDGLDNDGDGLTDFPADCGCTDIYDTTEAPNVTTECNDGIDNDGDGLIDYPLDCGCISSCDSSEAPNPVTQCNDGIDNDGDGFIDLADCGCSNTCDLTEGPRDQCRDGIDNDGDGFIDVADCGCSDTCDFSEGPRDQCRDGIDNDGDGLIDLADTNCVDSCDFSEFSNCTHRPCDVDANGNWTLTDIVGMVGMVFKGAVKPSPLCRADCNASGGNPTLPDIVYLVNKVFKGGFDPLPVGVCCKP